MKIVPQRLKGAKERQETLCETLCLGVLVAKIAE
jgi:hypothetical protein